MKHREEKYMAAIALLSAILIAAHGSSAVGPVTPVGLYSYWLIRIAAQSVLFFGARSLISTYTQRPHSLVKITTLAIVASHLPFVLSVTAFDIVLGYPELGIDGSETGEKSRITELVLEMFYLFDNHIALCLLLTLPGWILSYETVENPSADEIKTDTLLSALAPPLNGDILWVEAQEHYVQLTTQHEKRLVLARFSDIIRELSLADGMQVHRSHWVAKSAITQEQMSGQNMSLVLSSGDTVPVSRSFRAQIKANRKS
jgi:hypothetical protein